jgi:uncharacterized protein (DUF58 family)
MFKRFAVFAILALIFALSANNIFSQNVGKVKATISDMPDQIQAGQTAKVTVTITNTGSTQWTSENAYAHELGPFEINKEWTGEWKLEPGQSKEVYYKVTAPEKSGSYKMRIVIYNGNKKIGYRSKKVEVVSLTGK